MTRALRSFWWPWSSCAAVPMGPPTTGEVLSVLAQSVSGGERCAITAFAAAAIERTIVRSAGLVTDGALPAQRQNPAPNLPAYCRIEATVTTSADSRVNFEVWIPLDWNRKIAVTGNGGYSNALNVRDMAHALSQRYAAVGGDTGHQTPTPDDLLWGVRSS